MKLTKCKICRTPFKKLSIAHKVCSADCAIKFNAQEKAKIERRQLNERKVKARTRAEWLKLAQAAFNAFIRERDKSEPCIDCGGYPISNKYGGDWDAGHYLSRGAYPELRFNEDNCHKQLKSCNAGSGKFAHKQKTVQQEYRERLILKIGLERVEVLEGPHPPQKWTIEQLMEIRKVYKRKLKELQFKTLDTHKLSSNI